MIITEIERQISMIQINISTRDGSYEDTAFNTMKGLRMNNPKKITMGYLNINSIPNKFDGIMDVLSETKIDDSFPVAQFFYEVFSMPHRKDRILGGGGLLMYINDSTPFRKLPEHTTPDDIEIVC